MRSTTYVYVNAAHQEIRFTPPRAHEKQVGVEGRRTEREGGRERREGREGSGRGGEGGEGEGRRGSVEFDIVADKQPLAALD